MILARQDLSLKCESSIMRFQQVESAYICDVLRYFFVTFTTHSGDMRCIQARADQLCVVLTH